MTQALKLACRCGTVHIEVTGAPMVSAECHCKSCREAAAKLRALPDSQPIDEDNGGTHYILYRKDRVLFCEGMERLKEMRLKPDAPTRRVVAACCNTPVFLEFEHGHWLSLYAHLWPEGTAPKLEMRTMVSDRENLPPLPDDVPNAKTQSLAFMGKLMGAWIGMGFKVPKIAISGALHV